MLIIHNPTAGRSRGLYLDQVVAILRGHGVAPTIVRTTAPGHAIELARAAAQDDQTRIVAAGGDGTIAEVAQGLVGTHASLGVIPLGTANVLAHERSLGFTAASVARILVSAGRAPLWPGYVHTNTGRRMFVQMCGIGFDAQVVHTMPPRLKHALGRGAYVVQTLRALSGYAFPRLRLALDGIEHEAASAVISKGRLYAGPYRLLPPMPPGSSGFHVALFTHGGAGAVLAYGTLLPLHLLPHAPGMHILAARKVELLDGAAPVQTDGDPAGSTPLTIEDAPTPLTLIADWVKQGQDPILPFPI